MTKRKGRRASRDGLAANGRRSRRAPLFWLVAMVAMAAGAVAVLLLIRRSETNVDLVLVTRSAAFTSDGLGRLQLGDIKGYDKIQTRGDVTIRPSSGAGCPLPAGVQAVMLHGPVGGDSSSFVSLGSFDFVDADRIRLQMEDDVWTLAIARAPAASAAAASNLHAIAGGRAQPLVRATLRVPDDNPIEVLTNPPRTGPPCSLRSEEIELAHTSALTLSLAPASGRLAGELSERRIPVQGPIDVYETIEREIAGTPVRTATSSIVRGEITMLDLGQKKIALSPREALAITVGRGELVSLEGLADGYSLRFQGSVSRLVVGSPGRDLRPSWLEYLQANSPLRLYWAALTFLAGIALATYKALAKGADA